MLKYLYEGETGHYGVSLTKFEIFGGGTCMQRFSW